MGWQLILRLFNFGAVFRMEADGAICLSMIGFVCCLAPWGWVGIPQAIGFILLVLSMALKIKLAVEEGNFIGIFFRNFDLDIPIGLNALHSDFFLAFLILFLLAVWPGYLLNPILSWIAVIVSIVVLFKDS